MTTPRRTPGPPQRGGSPIRRGGSHKPVCPTHTLDMAYDPDRMVWGCTVDLCKMIALPKEDVDQGKGKPRIGTGILELVHQKTAKGDRWYLRAPDNNILIDITANLRRADHERDGRGGTTVEVTLKINNITEIT